EVGFPTRQKPVQAFAYVRPRFFVAGHQKVADLRLEPVYALLRGTCAGIEASVPCAAMRAERASRPTGFRRQPLLDPCMNLSAHTAPIRRTCRSCRYASERTGSSSPGPAFVENGWRVFCEP